MAEHTFLYNDPYIGSSCFHCSLCICHCIGRDSVDTLRRSYPQILISFCNYYLKALDGKEEQNRRERTEKRSRVKMSFCNHHLNCKIQFRFMSRSPCPEDHVSVTLCPCPNTNIHIHMLLYTLAVHVSNVIRILKMSSMCVCVSQNLFLHCGPKRSKLCYK